MKKFIARYFRIKKVKKDYQRVIDKLTSVDSLIENKYMMIDTEKYQVAMLDNLWSMYENERLIAFCENIKYYCDVQNGYKGLKVEKKANLLISLKYENDEVEPYAFFDGEQINLYQLTN